MVAEPLDRGALRGLLLGVGSMGAGQGRPVIL